MISHTVMMTNGKHSHWCDTGTNLVQLTLAASSVPRGNRSRTARYAEADTGEHWQLRLDALSAGSPKPTQL
jgi:hypothetical protein